MEESKGGENWTQEEVDSVKADYDMELHSLGVYEHLHGVHLVSCLLDSAFKYATSPLVLQAYPDVDRKLTVAHDALFDLYQALGAAWGDMEDKEEKEGK